MQVEIYMSDVEHMTGKRKKESESDDHHYPYRNCGLYVLKLFFAALTNVCTVKLALRH